ncbi:MAG: putative transport system ATP-binding protein [Patescibacteria group bacterium]|jgi:putative ABC transport system ATP-binding protein|nr:putative transport system ATP-binding protein [Patescibacteria group bacterium]
MIQVKNLKKTYSNGKIETQVLKGVDLTVKTGEFLAIMGKSGAGKSTLMYQMSILDEPTSGEIIIDDVNIVSLSIKEKTDFRLNKLGYVFQDYALVPELTAVENIMIPLLMRGMDTDIAKSRALKSLEDVGLTGKENNLPSQLSGGEQQRVSIARAVAQDPIILFADEPTANLDSASSNHIIEVLMELNKRGQTIIMVTHEKEYTIFCNRIIFLEDGKIIREDILRN